MGQPNPKYYYCKFEAIDIPTFSIQCFQLSVQIIIAVFFFELVRRRKQKSSEIQITQSEFQIYTLILLWTLISIMRDVMGLVYYQNYKCIQKSFVLYLSAIFNLLVATPAYFLHSLLFKIVNIWLFNLFERIDMEKMEQSEQLSLYKLNKVIKFTMKYQKNRSFVCWAFVIFQVILCLPPQQTKSDIGLVTAILEIVIINAQAFLIFVVYFYGLRKLREFTNFIRLSGTMIRQIIKQYYVLVVCCWSRFISNFLLMMLILFGYKDFTDHCVKDKNTSSYDFYEVLGLLYMSIGYILAHYLPICSLLKFYWPSQRGLFRNVQDQVTQVTQGNSTVHFLLT